MISGKVIGSLVATVKDKSLEGVKLLAVRLIENGVPGRIIIAADAVKVAGIGDHVYMVTGREAAIAFDNGMMAVDAGITGIIDSEGDNGYGKGSFGNGGNQRPGRCHRGGRRHGEGGKRKAGR